MAQLQPSRLAQCVNDDTFRPIVRGCRDEFDLTKTFQQSFLSIIPSISFIFFAIIQLAQQSGKPRLVGTVRPSIAKCLSASAFFVGNVLLFVASYLRDYGGHFPVEDAAASTAASVILPVLLAMQQAKSPRPSNTICTYLLACTLFGIIRTRTSWMEGQTLFSGLFGATTLFAFWLLSLETPNRQKTGGMGHLSPESMSSVLSKGFFSWLNGLIRRGYSEELSADDLYPLDNKLAAENYQSRFYLAFRSAGAKAGKAKRRPWSIIRALISAINTAILPPIPARLALGVFSFSQPFFIKSMLEWLQDSSNPPSVSVSFAYVGIIAFLHVGGAVSTGLYWYYQERALVCLRSCLVTAIYRKTIYRKTYSSENSSAITLMNSEVDIVRNGVFCIHEFWASLAETAVASWLLYLQIGAAFAAPLLIVLFCAASAFAVGHFASKRQGAWMGVLSKRVGLTSSVIPNLPAIKMSGLGSQVGRLVQLVREKEILLASRFRMMMVFSATISFLPSILSPIVTFTVSDESLSITKVFTSLAFINLICNPLIRVLQNTPGLLAAITSLGRIQDFLDSDAHDEATELEERYTDIDTAQIREENSSATNDAMINLHQAKLSWVSSKWTVDDINFTVPAGSHTLMAGPVGSGKTTACLGMLKETPYSEGIVSLKPGRRVAYCSQDPFIQNGTIRENIVGFLAFDISRYNRVVECCQLLVDFDNLPGGDQTRVGSKGIALSGGQRKRIGLARAAYSQPEIAILDDVFGGIDTHTAHEIEKKMFSSDGLFHEREAAVLLCSQSTQQAAMFDETIILRDGKVVWKGQPPDLPSEYVTARQGSSQNSEESETTSEPGVKQPESTKALSSPPNERVLRPPGGFANYKFYFDAVGGRVLFTFSILVTIAAFLYSSSALWLELWVSHQDDEAQESFYFRFYWGLQLTCIVVVTIYFSFNASFMSPKASSRIHFGALKTILAAPLDYYTTVDSSVPTGYMSQDMAILDTKFTNIFANTVVTVLMTAFQSVIVSIASPFLLFAYPVFTGMLYAVQRVYLRTSTQLRYLALETREPLYKHFIETIDGLATLRAFGWIDANIALDVKLLNNSIQSSYLLDMLHQWLQLMISLCVAVVAAVFVALASQYPTSAGFVGVALVNLMSLGETLGNLVRNFAELQTAAVALSRLRLLQKSVASEDEEDSVEKDTPTKSWPEQGSIQIDDVSAAYGSTRVYPGKQQASSNMNSLTLKRVSLDIQSGEHVIVCGRTGSGKSTLLLLLQGFLTPRSGRVTIDNLQPREIHRSALRDRIIALPQVPFFLTSEYTVRDNLEYHSVDKPLDLQTVKNAKFETQDADSEYALRAVGLWDILSARGGLDAELGEDSLSRGQKQLFSLARAILRQRLQCKLSSSSAGGVLLLDEFNTGLDSDTEKLMWSVIEKEFAGVTIVCVTHGLGAAADFDKAVVLSKGEIVEQGRPSVLLEDTNSKFRAIWTSRSH